MPGVIGRAVRRTSRKTSNKEATTPQPATPIYIVSGATSGSQLTLTFDQPVSLNGVPQFTTALAPTPVSAAQTAANVVVITYSGNVAGAEWVNVGFRDPAIRNSSGGFVTSNQVAIV